jgi:crossover junction endodeoxyribonuclease RusA
MTRTRRSAKTGFCLDQGGSMTDDASLIEVIQSSMSFTVPGKPAPQGSKRHVGHGILIESSREVGPWRERVALAAHNAMVQSGLPLITSGVTVVLDFTLPRPKSTPKRSTPAAVKRPDLDKLTRAVLDAITGTVIADDSQVVNIVASKSLAGLTETPGVTIRIETTP